MNNEGPSLCRQRFKGVESFLRRIAFNLGNSPSQTEVKIISCIPIDVTDLQQKILDLEKLLRRTTKPPAIVHTALCEAGVASNDINDAPAFDEDPNPDSQKILSYDNIDLPEQNDIQPSPCSSTNSILDEHNNKIRKNFFKKCKKKKPSKIKQSKVKNPMVYYAHQTDNSPFKPQKMVEKKPKTKKEKANKDPNTSYLTDIIRRQYEPMTYNSGESSFSSPVCRDIKTNYVTADGYVSETYSCCHLNFVNIDKNKPETEYFGFTPNFHEQIQNQNMYYDSSLYDLVPVKEVPVKPKKNIDIPKRHHNKNVCNFPHCDYGYKPYVHPMCVNYHTIIPTQPVPHSLPRRTPSRKKRRPIYRRPEVRNVSEITQEDTSNSCRVECGNVYKKPVNKKFDIPKRVEVKNYPVTYNNAVTSTFQDTECQTTTETQNVETNSLPSQDVKTEETLNQIKTILQCVLTEVKTNTKAKAESEQKAKKDAVVQKGASFGIMPGSSRLLNSFTYSPYNVAPYSPPYSHPVNPNHPWPGVPYPAKCMHNFPVFIQTPGRHACAACFRKASHVTKAASSRGTSSQETSTQATSTATNTHASNQNYETEKLIKEIYKSMALNIPKKETSVSNYSSTPKRTSRTSTKSSCCYGTDKSVSARQCTDNSLPRSLYRRAGPMTSGLTPFTSNMFSNKMTSNTVSVQSHVVSATETDRRLRSERLGHYLATTQEMPAEESAARKIMQAERKALHTRAPTESSSEESDDDQLPTMKTEVQKKERNNLFTKMMNSVKLFKNRRRKSQKSKLESEEEESDSDDYQTVYSQQMEQARRAPVMQTRRIPHSKVSYSRHVRGRNQEKLRKNMEQEYRRQWNEQFMFQQHPYGPGSGRNSPGYYGQIYEARPAMVEQSVSIRSFVNQTRPFVLPKRAPPSPVPVHAAAAKGLAWFKKRCKCGEHFKSLIVDN